MELTGISRKKSSAINCVLIALLSVPCVLGFNLWQSDAFSIFGGTIMDLEDFLVSNIFLPLGSLIFCLFCCQRYGWGWNKFIAEADAGEGMKFPRFLRFYLTWILPVVLLFIFVEGYIQKFF